MTIANAVQPTDLTDEDYRRLAELRSGLRGFLHWSSELARSAGLTPAQHQLLLTVKASEDPLGPTIGDVADVLLIRHHSAVGLVDRAQEAGLIRRERNPEHPSVVHLRLTDDGAGRLRSLSAVHLRELAQLAPTMRALWAAIRESDRTRVDP